MEMDQNLDLEGNYLVYTGYVWPEVFKVNLR